MRRSTLQDFVPGPRRRARALLGSVLVPVHWAAWARLPSPTCTAQLNSNSSLSSVVAAHLAGPGGGRRPSAGQ